MVVSDVDEEVPYLAGEKKSSTFAFVRRKVGRVIECAGLEIRYTPFGDRGFESLTFRKEKRMWQLSHPFFVVLNSCS